MVDFKSEISSFNKICGHLGVLSENRIKIINNQYSKQHLYTKQKKQSITTKGEIMHYMFNFAPIIFITDLKYNSISIWETENFI